MFRISILSLLFCLVSNGYAETIAVPSNGDPRIQYISYDVNEVFQINIVPKLATLVLFGDGEVISDMGIDDPLGVTITTTVDGDGIFLEFDSENSTQMIVITNKRTYTLLLNARESNKDHYYSQVRFQYKSGNDGRIVMASPTDSTGIATNNSNRSMDTGDDFGKYVELDSGRYSTNIDYNWKGDVSLLPEKVFDNGLYTFFEFAGEVPAIFEVMPNRKERLLNRNRYRNMIVVHKVVKQLTLRLGDEQLCIFNMDVYKKQKLYKADGVFENAQTSSSR